MAQKTFEQLVDNLMWFDLVAKLKELFRRTKTDLKLYFSNGTNTTVEGTGTEEDPIKINSSGGAGSGELEKITEGGKTGYRIKGTNPANYGDTGQDAIDFSVSTQATNDNGSKGQRSFTVGLNNENNWRDSIVYGKNINITNVVNNGEDNLIGGDSNTLHNHIWESIFSGYNNEIGVLGALNTTSVVYMTIGVGSFMDINGGHGSAYFGSGLRGGAFSCTVVGVANEDITGTQANYLTAQFNNANPRFIVGCGTMNPDSGVVSLRANGFVVMNDGKVSAPLQTIAFINAIGAKALTTKEYVNKNTLIPYTVATLPASPSQGDQYLVTDSTAPTYLATVTGGGAVKCPVFYDGTNWICH